MTNITKHTLENGLTVFLKEVHAAPIISWWVVYRVGSRNEPTGKTGVSHWVEHMMFKGTPKYPGGMLDRAIDRIGGRWNAFTSLDYTMYHETLPAEHIDLALESEADRMTNAIFDLAETESERTVIISERQGSENSPMFWLREEMNAVAFRVHGYHHHVLGDLADLQTITRDDLYGHYRQHYVPTNAFVIGVGAFDTPDMLAKVKTIYGAIPIAPAPKHFVRAEPEPQGERRVIVNRPGHTAFLRVSFRTPSATEPDWFKVDMLDSILTGPGGGIDNKTSRLYQALVKTEITAGVSGGLSETIDPYLYSITMTVRDGHTIEEAEAAFNVAIQNVIDNGVTEAELNRAKKQAKASFAYEMESVSNQAYWIAQSAILGEDDWYERYLARIEAVTTQDIQEAAARYLIPERRITGWLVPTGLDG
ncbi:MAG: pitrilysin family protein [Aggregatilineales bacterium]